MIVHTSLEELKTSVSTSVITGKYLWILLSLTLTFLMLYCIGFIIGDQLAISSETRLKLGMGSNMYPYHQLLYLDKKAIRESLGNQVMFF